MIIVFRWFILSLIFLYSYLNVTSTGYFMTLYAVRATDSMDIRTFCTSDAILLHTGMYCILDNLLFCVDFYDSSFDRMDGLYLELFDVTRIHVFRSMIWLVHLNICISNHVFRISNEQVFWTFLDFGLLLYLIEF